MSIDRYRPLTDSLMDAFCQSSFFAVIKKGVKTCAWRGLLLYVLTKLLFRLFAISGGADP